MRGPSNPGWKVIGSGRMADEIRAELARDPDKYRPETWSMKPEGHCPCCDQDVFRCTTRHTKFVEGFATHGNVVHPRCGDDGHPSDAGAHAGCCCVAPNFGPKHAESAPPVVRKRSRRST